MREILCRGKTIQGEWVEGFYFEQKRIEREKQVEILQSYIDGEKGVIKVTPVIPETVGQYTGKDETNGAKRKIFEGDIYLDCHGRQMVIVWLDRMACFSSVLESDPELGFPLHFESNYLLQVIGNIHDNKEILKEGAE